MKKLMTLYKSVGKYWPFAVLTPLFMVGEAILELQIPGRISNIITYLQNLGEQPIDSAFMWGEALWLIVFSLASMACGVLGALFGSRASAGFSANLKNRLFRKVQTFSFSNIDKYSSSSLITRMNTDVQWVNMSFSMSIRMIFRSPTIFAYALIKASRISKDLMLVYLIAIPILVVGLTLIHVFAHPQFEAGVKKVDKVNEVVEENVRGVRVVKSFTREEDEIKKFDKENNLLYKYFKRGQTIVQFTSPLMMIAIYTVILLIVIIGVNRIESGQIYEMVTYSLNILIALNMLSMVFTFMVISKPSRERIYEVLTEVPTIKSPENAVEEVKDGSVEFKNVFFKYNLESEKYVLNNINLKINSGETVGILGTTGSSKTTLISLIARLYDTLDGDVLVGGVNVKDYDLEVLRDAVSVVLQKNQLFSGSIIDNLRWGKEDATLDEIKEACKIAQASSFIEAMPNKYESKIEQGGSNVSGGQKQRLCIARAILKDPKILILDDSMSAVDTKTDALIRAGLKEYKKDITKIIVAQRYMSVQDADKIIIIDNGEIIDCGTHEELLKTSKTYQEIYHSQNQEASHE